jgi:hypothetical protein
MRDLTNNQKIKLNTQQNFQANLKTESKNYNPRIPISSGGV